MAEQQNREKTVEKEPDLSHFRKGAEFGRDKEGEYISPDGIRLYPIIKGEKKTIYPGHVYAIKAEKKKEASAVDIWLEEVAPLKLPDKCSFTTDDELYVDAIQTVVKSGEYPNVGIMFHGVAGGGKTVAMNYIAIKLGVPIIIGNPDVTYCDHGRLLADYKKTEVVYLLDEWDKGYKRPEDEKNGKDLLQWLDGSDRTQSKVVIFTANQCLDVPVLSNRPSRILFWKKYDQKNDDKSFIQTCIEAENVKDQKGILFSFIANMFESVTRDTATAFIKYVKIFQIVDGVENFNKQSLFDAASQINVKLKQNTEKYKEVQYNKESLSGDTTIDQMFKAVKAKNADADIKKFMKDIGAVYIKQLDANEDPAARLAKLMASSNDDDKFDAEEFMNDEDDY